MVVNESIVNVFIQKFRTFVIYCCTGVTHSYEF